MELKDSFKSTDKFIYHYTTFDSALKILVSQKLKYSDMSNSNDINESWRPQYTNPDGTPYNDPDEYRTICFTKDTDGVCGFTRSSMWGHYADHGYGVCLVFDRKTIISRIPSGIKCDDIDYDNYESADVPFRKTPEWAIEAEFRIAKKADSKCDEYLEFDDNALVAIIMYYAKTTDKGDYCFDSYEFKILSGLFDKDKILCYTGNHMESLFEESLVNYKGEPVWKNGKF
ncbi:MAG: DUF2971 domain-containing protein [Bacteroidales bacterium]|nr:DUF2971 domain-containing protein [Bacteroidales bacterium]